MGVLNRGTIILLVIVYLNKFVSSNRTLNILRPRRTRVVTHQLGQYKAQLLIPRNTISVTTVTIGQKVVFTCEAPEKVDFVFVRSLYGVERLLNIAVIRPNRQRNVYLAYTSGTWGEVDQDTFSGMKEILRTDRKLDIAEPLDVLTFTSERHNLYGLPAFVISCKYDLNLVAIYDNYEVIWQQEDYEQSAAFLIVHGRLNSTNLINIIVKGKSESYNLYYKKNGSEWEQVTKTEFYLTLDLLDLEVIIDRIGFE
ncbi:hypothetical protein TpMuguga_02g00211 [Theileria parva strain Muguga]|uniref:Uncharacterized protein n=1 Tax=Theileria parva TaxID=5875 RepID=Q4N5T0_THEPA|nr:uncharacterized protein TpMuguga_02g00211 [Theileria parva strain Muguga]EAN32493.1 hypothetical protein TpMuguga_02g00211 [Theileria parva strain Muguga]|eukprot:XP_764776.1 hypothetical protein [Theileria parva strain Muguga]